MKLLKTGAFCALLQLCYASASAQLHPAIKDGDFKKSEIFSDLPSHMNFNMQAAVPLLQKGIGDAIRLQLSPDFIFTGVVVSKSDVSERRSQTVVIKSTNRQGAAFTITKMQKSDGSYTYSGRILSLNHSDAYEVVEKGGAFSLEKKPLSDIVTE